MYPARAFVGLVLGAAAALLAAGAVRAQAPDLPSQEPQLRIDPGMHTAPIRRIGVNQGCALLATGSEDKTVRLWRLPEGRLLTTLRPPIGPGNDGKVYAVAMAPDGSWVAAGGWSSAGDGDWVYVFSAATGAVTTRLGPLPQVIFHLAVSHDSRYLAATLGGGHGLLVWERTGAEAWQLVAEHEDYGGTASYGAAFDRSGTLFTVANDGKLRRYAPGYTTKPESVATRGGRRPFSVAVHPAGDRVAVGYDDTTAVEVYDAATLAWRFAADTADVRSGDLSSVAWSADGTRLYAGSLYEKNGLRQVRVWNRDGKNPRDLDGPLNTITHLLPCHDGVVFGAADPAFGLLASDGGRRLWQENVQTDMRGKRYEHFTVSRDGLRVRFGLMLESEESVLFDLAAERLSDAPDVPQDFHQADTRSLDIQDWINNTNPKLVGVPIKLEEYEMARSLAIAPDKQRFVLGAEWSLRAYDKDGKELWQKQVPGIAWGVNIPRDGKLLVAAYSDGTIRWHRLSDGLELLALFVHAKDRRWVAWTPKGYYTASPGGESLIGWHINRGWNDAADFFPAHRFRKQFSRPDIVGRILADLDEDKAIKDANLAADRGRGNEDIKQQIPPVVTILSPRDGSRPTSDDVTVEYTLRSPTGLPITRVAALVNGAIVATDNSGTGRLQPGDRVIRQIAVKVPAGQEATISINAAAGAYVSEPVSIALRPGTAAPRVRPIVYALVAAVGDYGEHAAKLPAAANDATLFAAQLKKQAGRAYKDVVLFQDKPLIDKDATQPNLIAGVEWLKQKVSGSDLAIIYFSGHGRTTTRRASYLLPFGYDQRLSSTMLDKARLFNLLSEFEGKVILILDVCLASDGLRHLLDDVEDTNSHIMALASSLEGQVSRSSETLSHFTRALIEGMDGKITGKSVVTVRDLEAWLEERVDKLSGGKQLPNLYATRGPNRKYFIDLPLAVLQ
jgi:WD40 repeat protein